jgi:hypothetical protein
MADLTHWDFAEHFSAYDAAALILGLEPRDSDTEEWRVRVVTDRMKLHYKHALTRIFSDTLGDPIEVSESEAINAQIALPSVKADELHHRCWLYGEETTLSDWLNNRLSNFENQEFARNTIARWLDTIGMNSVYPFDRQQGSRERKSDCRWPWGSHHTETLGHLEAAARRYWAENYDPSDATTAPTNATVSEWLQTDRKVSKTMADSIASMLRPDGLPTGPRKLL